MKELKEILSVLHSIHLEKLPVIDEDSAKIKSLQERLIDGVVSSRFNTDQDAAKGLYGHLYDKHRYELLKSKLKQRALSSLMLYEIKDTDTSPRDAMRIHLKRQIVSANLLLLFGARTTGVKLLKKILPISSDFLLNDCMFEALLLLRSHYWFCSNTAMHSETSRLLEEQIDILGAEVKAEHIYQSVTIAHGQSTSNNKSPISKLKKALMEMDRLKKYLHLSYIVSINTFKLQVAYYQLNHQYTKVTEECEKAIVFFNLDKALRNDPLSIYFLLNQSEAYFLDAKPDKIFACVDRLRAIIGQKTANRAALDRIAFYACVYTAKYSEAEKILNSFDIQKTPLLPNQRIEWQLYTAYIQMLKYEENGSDPSTLRSLSLPTLSKDKHGANISIIICDTAINILLKNHSTLLRLDKKLDNYIYRNLSGDLNNERSVLFLKMLRIVIKEDFNRKLIEKKSNAFFEKLKLNKLRSFVEIVPYEKMWLLLLHSLS